MSDTAATSVTTERHESVLVITLDDGRANALTRELFAAVTDAVRAAESDPEVKAVVITGREGRFSGGFDLGVMRGDDLDAISNLAADGAMLVHTLYSAKVPVVAACSGHAIAMGAMILLGCDLRIGAEGDFKFGMTEHAIGMSLPDWAVTILSERVPRTMLQRTLMNAEVYGPEGAVSAGFLDVVVPADRVLAEAIETAQQLGDQIDLRARASTLKRLRGPMLATLEEQATDFRDGGVL